LHQAALLISNGASLSAAISPWRSNLATKARKPARRPRSSIAGEEEIDTVEDWLDEETLALRRKRFFKAGKQVLQVDYSKLELIKASWIARDIELTDTRGFQLRLNVTEYEPGFPVTDAVLHVQSP